MHPSRSLGKTSQHRLRIIHNSAVDIHRLKGLASDANLIRRYFL